MEGKSNELTKLCHFSPPLTSASVGPGDSGAGHVFTFCVYSLIAARSALAAEQRTRDALCGALLWLFLQASQEIASWAADRARLQKL